MAPTRSKRSNIRARAVRARTTDPRGRYAPPSPTSDPTNEPDPNPQPEPKSSLKRRRDTHVDDDTSPWRLNKRDKRTIKHNNLLARVHSSGIQKHPPRASKPRRPNKKLQTDLSALASALPELEDDDDDDDDDANMSYHDSDEDEWEGVSEDGHDGGVTPDASIRKRNPRRRRPSTGAGKMTMKSLHHRPGAMKRKRKMEGAEMERFARNLARMAPAGEVGGPSTHAGNAQAERWAALRGFIGSTLRRDKAFLEGGG